MLKPIDYKSQPEKSKEELDEIFSPDTIYIIEDVLENQRSFHLVFQGLLDVMKYGFEYEEIRRRITFFKFKKSDEDVNTIQLNHFISNLTFWRPLIDVNKVHLLDNDWIFDFSKFNAKSLMDYVNDFLLPVYDSDFASQNAMVDELYSNIVNIASSFCLLMGMSISLYDLWQFEERNPEAKELIRADVDITKDPSEIENEMAARVKSLIQLMIEDEVGNDYKPFFASGSSLKETQFKEFIVKIGYKADQNGNTIPIFINNNFLYNGLDKPSLICINAISGRKAAILSKLAMGAPGAFSKKLVYQSCTSTLAEHHDMCDSVVPVEYVIKDALTLQLMNGRYYYDDNGELTICDGLNDTHLIGQVVNFRSPATCTGKDGVCKYCYGHLHDINKSMESAGALAALKITEPIGQTVLGSKHDQTTNSNEISFSEGFDEAFALQTSSIVLRDDSKLDSDLYIRLCDVEIEEMDDTEYYHIGSFDVLDANGNFIRNIAESSGSRLYINDHIVTLYKQRTRGRATDHLIPLEDIDEEEALFTVEIKNRELTEPLKIFTKILNTDAHMGATTISELCQLFLDKLISMGTKFDATHSEMIIRSLIRKRSDILEFPDFSAGGNHKDVRILKLNDGQLYNPSSLISIQYGFLRRQLLSPELYRKSNTGPLDALFISDLHSYVD